MTSLFFTTFFHEKLSKKLITKYLRSVWTNFQNTKFSREMFKHSFTFHIFIFNFFFLKNFQKMSRAIQFSRAIGVFRYPSAIEESELHNNPEVKRLTYANTNGYVNFYCRTKHSHPMSWWQNQFHFPVHIEQVRGSEQQALEYVGGIPSN